MILWNFAALAVAPPDVAELEARVRAIFEERCAGCHDASVETVELPGDLTHLRRDASVGRPYVVPGRPDDCYLLDKLTGAPQIEGSPMPLGEDPLPAEELDAIRAWVVALDAGSEATAAAPPTTEATGTTGTTEPTGPTGPATRPAPATPPRPAAPVPRPRPAFGGTHQVALHTTTTLGKKAVEFRIHHRFGEIRRPFRDRTFFGLASGAVISLGGAYGIVDGLDVLLRFANSNLGHELGVKWVPLRQEAGRPLSFGVYGSFEQFWAQQPIDGCAKQSHCSTGNAQAMLSRLWFDRWATQLTAGYSALTNHSPVISLTEDGETTYYHDWRGTLDVGVASSVWLDKRRKWGVDVEYFLPIPVDEAFYFKGGNASPNASMIGGWAVGLSARAGLHFFQVFATNVANIHTNLVAPGGDSGAPFSRQGAHFLVGFNLSRKWNL
jgi:mono/diheme cytochrome c family protein